MNVGFDDADNVYFDDASIAKGFIEEVPGLHGAVSFEYRPCRLREMAKAAAAVLQTKDAGEVGSFAELMISLLKSWDITGGEGEPVPITLENIRNLHSQPYFKIRDTLLFGRHDDALVRDLEDSDVAILIWVTSKPENFRFSQDIEAAKQDGSATRLARLVLHLHELRKERARADQGKNLTKTDYSITQLVRITGVTNDTLRNYGKPALKHWAPKGGGGGKSWRCSHAEARAVVKAVRDKCHDQAIIDKCDSWLDQN